MSDSKIFVLYHGPTCRDGFAAALAAWLKFGDEAKYIPMGYGDPLPEIPDGSEVYFLDYSRNRSEMSELGSRCKVTVIDHHKTAQEACTPLEVQEIGGHGRWWLVPVGAQWKREGGLQIPTMTGYNPVDTREEAEAALRYWNSFECIFDMEHSGAVLAWQYFFLQAPLPKLFEYIEDRDLWKHKLPDTEAVNVALMSVPMEFERWKALLNAEARCRYEPWNIKDGKQTWEEAKIEQLAEEGQAMLKYRAQLVDDICKFARTEQNVVYVNASALMSDLGHALLERYPVCDVAVIYWQKPDATWQWSLRSRDQGPDVSAIAKTLGGGGHKNAAGFESRELLRTPFQIDIFGNMLPSPFIKTLMNKNIF